MLIATLCALGCSLMWAGTTVAGKALATSMPAFVFAFTRYLMASLCLFPFLSRTEIKTVKTRHLPSLLFLGFTIVFLFNLFFFSAFKYTSATSASLVGAINPILTLFITCLLFRHIPKKAQLLAFLLSFAGVSMIITKGHMGLEVLSASTGEFLVIAGVLSQIAYALTAKKISAEFSPLFISFAASASGILFLLPFVMNKEFLTILHTLTLSQWMILGYVGTLGTATGILCYATALKRIGAAKTSLMVYSTMPVFVFILSYVLLREHATLWHAVGGTLVISSLFIGLRY